MARDAAGNVSTSAAVTVTVSNTAPPPTSGLVGAWSFNAGTGTAAADSSGSGNVGALSGATWVTTGKFGSALSFNGTNSRVHTADSASLDLTNGMTLEAWVRPTAVTNWRTVMLKEGPSGLVYSLYASDGTGPNGFIRVGSVDRGVTAPPTLPLNTWSHLAITYDGANLRLFLNGTQAAVTAGTGSMTATTGALRIGGNAVWSEWFSGLIDEVRIYKTALSATQIQTDMNTPIP